MTPQIYELGDSALTIEFGNEISESVHQEVMKRFYQFQSFPLPGTLDLIPAYASLTIVFDLGVVASRFEGLAGMKNLERTRREVVRTPYGEASGAISFGLMSGHEVAFLPRHGYGHTLAPHEINYRANIWALKQVGVDDMPQHQGRMIEGDGGSHALFIAAGAV